MRRFLLKSTFAAGQRLLLPAEESQHARLSLRLAPGDHVLLANGEGIEAEALILSFSAAGAELEVLGIRRQAAPGAKIELIQAPLKGPRMDWLVEKAAELGLSRLRLVDSQHTVASGEKTDRWNRLATAALKQSGNLEALEISQAEALPEILRSLPEGSLRFLLSPSAKTPLAEAIRSAPAAAQRVLLAVGPEGGFSLDEESAFQSAGFLPCRLSPNILRGETAALAALAIAKHTLDNRH